MEQFHYQIKRKRKVVEIEYQMGRPTLRVIRAAGKHMTTMGCPQRGGHELFPEEAVFLHETGSGIIQYPNGQHLSMFQAFGVLESCRISFEQYHAYKTIRLTGLVILRPRQSTIQHEANRSRNFSNQPSTSNPYQNSCSGRMNEQNVVRRFDEIDSKLFRNPRLVSFLDLQNFKSKFEVSFSRRPNKPCRPTHRPLNPSVVSAQSWDEYRRLDQQQTSSRRGYRFQKPNSAELRRHGRCTVDEAVDFNVFSPAGFSHNLPARPLFSVVCVGSNSPPLNIPQLSQMHNVIVAIREPSSNISFVSLSGYPIDLRCYLEPLGPPPPLQPQTQQFRQY